MNISRQETRQVHFSNVAVGGGAPISVQSMTNTKTENVSETVAQIRELTENGCEIIRVAVPDKKSASRLGEIKNKISIPLVADIHFDYKLALTAIEQGVDGLRINPGNIGKKSKVVKVVRAAKKANLPLRIGINAGSLKKKFLKKYGHPTARAMVASAEEHISILEENNFYDIIISLKATDIQMTVNAYKIMARKVNYPFHIGITEAGTSWSGTIKSAIGIGALLLEGLGDTVRVSLTGDPVLEVKVARKILQALGLRQHGPEIISCPTCGRTEIDLIDLAERVEKALAGCEKPITVAVMGCVVNGPGEAREADIGIAGGKDEGMIFKEGKFIKKVAEEQLIDSLLAEIEKM